MQLHLGVVNRNTPKMATKKIHSSTRQLQVKSTLPRFKSVLIIDNSDVDLFINEALLNELCLSREVKHELSPSNVINQLKKADRLSDVPELIFLDLKIENKDGFSFLDEFKQLSDFIKNRCKIVIISDSHQQEDKFRILINPNVIHYLIKPLDAFQLKEIIY